MPWRSGLTPRRFAVLGLLAMIQPLATSFYLPALPELAADLGTTPAQAQLTLSAALVGLALGQFVLGSLSDRWGRRPLMVAGMGLFAVASLLCAIAPSLTVLIVLRFIQGFAGAAGTAIARASIRDVTSGTQTASALSKLLAVIGVAPIAGPIVGSLILLFTTWRGLFVALSLIGLVSFLVAIMWFPETLTPERRLRAQGRNTRGAIKELLSDKRVRVVLVVTTLLGIISFGWSTTSPFYFIDWYRLTPQQYAVIVGTNSIAFVIGATGNARWVGRIGPRTALIRGLAIMLTAAVTIALLTIVKAPVLWPIVIIVLLMGAYGGQIANAQVLGLGPYGRLAGTMSALLGMAQFVGGATIPPLLTGLFGPVVTLPLLLVASTGLALLFVIRGLRPQAT